MPVTLLGFRSRITERRNSAHELAVVGEKLDERPTGSDSLGGCHLESHTPIAYTP